MNTEMAYLLGMITGNGEIQRGMTATTISIVCYISDKLFI